MSLAQDLRNAWDIRDRDEFERLLLKLPSPVQLACAHANAVTCMGSTAGSTSRYCPDCRQVLIDYQG